MIFPQRWADRVPCISSYVMTTDFRLYIDISQILLLYKTLGYHNKFDYEILGVYYWYVKILQCGYVKYGLTDAALYVQKHITLAPWAICYKPPLVRDLPPGVPAFVRLVYWKCCPQNFVKTFIYLQNTPISTYTFHALPVLCCGLPLVVDRYPYMGLWKNGRGARVRWAGGGGKKSEFWAGVTEKK